MRQFFGFESTVQSVPAGFNGVQPWEKMSVGTSAESVMKDILLREC